jgi:hypothetical protein
MGLHGEPSRQRRMNGDLPPAGRSWTPQARSMAPAAAPGLPVSSPMWCRLSPHSVYRSITRVSVSFCGVGKRFQFGPACVITGMSCCFRTRRTCGMPCPWAERSTMLRDTPGISRASPPDCPSRKYKAAMSDYEFVRLEVGAEIATTTLNGPPVNPLSIGLVRHIRRYSVTPMAGLGTYVRSCGGSVARRDRASPRTRAVPRQNQDATSAFVLAPSPVPVRRVAPQTRLPRSPA